MDLVASALMRMQTPGFDSGAMDLQRYAGTWYEVASYKRGINSFGQTGCRNTKGVYTYHAPNRLDVSTSCLHKNGRVSGIDGHVVCSKGKTCQLTFPTIPFFPPQEYEVLKTDYENFAVVSGSSSGNFIQVYSRRPHLDVSSAFHVSDFLRGSGINTDLLEITSQDTRD